MCAILDANRVVDVFAPGGDRNSPAKQFFKCVNDGRLRLVAGGKLLEELSVYREFCRWWAQAVLSGNVLIVGAERVAEKTNEIEPLCGSDDPHVIAVAQLSGARLLFTNDRDLVKDFANPRLIGRPRGRVYTTLDRPAFGRVHKELLGNRNLCRVA